jgi:predicted N-acetyltransferase YhbS
MLPAAQPYPKRRPMQPYNPPGDRERFRLLRERPGDGPEVEWLLDLAFAPGRTALSSYRLRQGVPPVAELCTVVRDEYDALAGCIRYWPVRIGACGGEIGAPALLLGPVAVHPTRQGEGIGALIMRETLADAAALGWTRVVLVGDEPYYARFGFSREVARNLAFPPPYNPDRLLGRALAPDAFDSCSGMVRPWIAAATLD